MATNDPDCRALLRLIRATIEEHCPPGDCITGRDGPSLLAEAEAPSAAIVAMVNRLSFEPREMPPSPSYLSSTDLKFSATALLA